MMVRRKITSIFAIIFIIVLTFGFAVSSFCQDPNPSPLLFNRSIEIENYARTGYHLYGRTQIARSLNPRYDSFGNYLMNGVSIFQWNEEKINSRHTDPKERYSTIDKRNPVDGGGYFNRYLGDLVVLSETNRAFSSRFIVGNEVRVKFSPLTVDMAALSGIRWDFNYEDNNLTLISSRADTPIWFGGFVGGYMEVTNIEARDRLLPVYLTGAHFERNLGIFNIAANYVNTYTSDSAQSRAKNSITGTIAHDRMLLEPLQLVVKLEDGSRFDGGGPRIYDILPVVNGVERPELLVGVTRGNWEHDLLITRKNNDPNRDLYQARYFLEPLRIPDFFEFNNYDKSEVLPEHIITRRYSTDPNVYPLIQFSDQIFTELRKNEPQEGYLECNGEDYILFWFEIPQDEEIESVEFKALVGNNYIFSLSEVYKNVESEFNPSEIGLSNATYFEPALYSRGDIKDMSNVGWVKFEHGNPTANMLMSIRIDTEFKGFKMTGEYSRNMKFRQYSHQKAKKFREDAEAYYINFIKEFGEFSFGAEYFKMDPDYSTNFKNRDRTYERMRDLWSSHYRGDASLVGNGDVMATPQTFMNLTQIIDTVDDNDDKDRYPDWHIYSTIRDRNGVFPGLDRNGNNRTDVNENDNLIPDYVEPFFLYYVDPDEYDYGLDLNNNSTIDIREDDDKPDYPYNLDSKGYHVFGSYGSDIGWRYTLGFVNFDKIANGGKTDVRYGIAEYNRFIPFFADLKFATTFKKVEDSIEDNVFKYSRHLSTTLIDSTGYGYNMFEGSTILDDRMTQKYYDPLRYRDSYVSKSYFETNLFRIENLNIGMRLKYEVNHQKEAYFQDKNDIIDRTQIYKADYRFYLKDFLIQPQVKFLSRRYTNGDGIERTLHEEYFYPIIRLEYPLTLNTTFRAGVQGIPGLNATVRNLVNNQLDYDTRNYTVMLSNMSFYQGYDFSLNFGFESRWQEFNGVARQVYNRTDRIYFVRLIMGLEPIS